MLLDKFWFGLWKYWLCEKFGLDLYEYVHGVLWEKFIGIHKLCLLILLSQSFVTILSFLASSVTYIRLGGILLFSQILCDLHPLKGSCRFWLR